VVSGPRDVRFDWQAASAASSACRQAANRMDGRTTRRGSAARRAQAGWTGEHAETFEGLLAGELEAGTSLATILRDTANAIDQAAGEARAEQQRRERIRAEMRAEEERRRQEARTP
jgi:uncharacterized protein YukE